jgi:hypothetical protein
MVNPNGMIYPNRQAFKQITEINLYDLVESSSPETKLTLQTIKDTDPQVWQSLVTNMDLSIDQVGTKYLETALANAEEGELTET